jgi:broad specificity phosphatase PhoE
MRPKRIILIRHGESMANVDRSLHGVTPDHRIELTAKGHKQAMRAGSSLYDELVRPSGDVKPGSPALDIRFYTSPYSRTRQTFQGILEGLKQREPGLQYTNYEDPRLREQEFGNFRPPGSYDDIEVERDNFGTFFYRIPGGESGADVFDRLSGAMDTMHRDFQKPDFPENMIVVSHGLTIRLFLMRWFHWTVEEFEMLRNPRNCEFYVLDRGERKYQLLTEMRKYTEAETRAYLARKKPGSVDMTYANNPLPQQ